MKIEKLKTLLGFAQKSKKIISGEAAVKALLPKGKIHLLILAEDLTEKRKKHWTFAGHKQGIKVFEIGSKLELGLAIGLSPRAVIGILDKEMAQAIEAELE